MKKLLNQGEQMCFAALIFSIFLVTEAQGDRTISQLNYIRSEQVALKNDVKALNSNISSSLMSILKGQDQLVKSDMKNLQSDIKSFNQSFTSIKTLLGTFETKLSNLEKSFKTGNPSPKVNVSLKKEDFEDEESAKLTDSSSGGGDCSQMEKLGFIQSGVYEISVNGQKKEVYCDMETDGGGWTMIQRREATTGSDLNFSLNWKDYENGFGNVSASYWLGLRLMGALTKHWDKELRIDMEDFDGKWTYAKYSTFSVSGLPKDKYKLNVEGYSGNAGDSLSYHNNQFFSTPDKDNDNDGSSCAQKFKAGWWYSSCYFSNLNGEYINKGDDVPFGTGIVWYTLKNSYYYSLKTVEMKIRNKHFM